MGSEPKLVIPTCGLCLVLELYLWIRLNEQTTLVCEVNARAGSVGSAVVVVRQGQRPVTIRLKYPRFTLNVLNITHICSLSHIYAHYHTYMLTVSNTCSLSNIYAFTANAEVHTKRAISRRKRSRERLHRHGFNYKKRCRLHDHADTCLLNASTTMFAGLFHYERLHVYFINFCTYCLEALATCVPASEYGRVSEMCLQCQQFRDPNTGVTHPRLPDVLKMTHLTAERRVRAIFIWAHVLGTRAEVIAEPCRMHAKVAVAALQILLIAVRGHRPYSFRELVVIFKDVGTQFFRSLEQIAIYVEQERLRKERLRYDRNPIRHRAPKPFQRSRRFVTSDARYRTYMLNIPHI